MAEDGVGPYAIGHTIWPGLSKLAEEAGEVIQVIGKLMGTGGLVDHWDGTNLDQRLLDELADLNAAIRFFLEANPHSPDIIRSHDQRTQTKYELFWTWHRAQAANA